MEKPLQLTRPLQFTLYLLAIIVLIGIAVLLSSLNTNVFNGDIFGKVTQVVEGSICQVDIDCAEGVCVSNMCIVEKECTSDEDCGTEGAICADNVCVVKVIVNEEAQELAVSDEESLTQSSTSALCISDSDCSDESACTHDVCLTEAGVCTFIEIRCGDNERCADGVCVLLETETTSSSGGSGGYEEEQSAAAEVETEGYANAVAEESVDAAAVEQTVPESSESTSELTPRRDRSEGSDGDSSVYNNVPDSALINNDVNNGVVDASTPQCHVNEDCPIIQFCDLADNTCKDGCRTDDDCFGGKCVSGNCEQSKDCVDDLDCNLDEVCKQGLCVIFIADEVSEDSGDSSADSSLQTTLQPPQPQQYIPQPDNKPAPQISPSNNSQLTSQIIAPETAINKSNQTNQQTTNQSQQQNTQSVVGSKCTQVTQHIDCSAGFACDPALLSCFEECKDAKQCQPGFSCFDNFCNIDFVDCKADKDCPAGMFCSAMFEICQQCDDTHACANAKFSCDPLGICYDAALYEAVDGSDDGSSDDDDEGADFDDSGAGFDDSGYTDYGFDDGIEYDDGSGYPPLTSDLPPDSGLPSDGLPPDDMGADAGLGTDGSYEGDGSAYDDGSGTGADAGMDSSLQYQDGSTDSSLSQQGQGQGQTANLLIGQAGAGTGTSTETDEEGLGGLWWAIIVFVTLGMVSGMAVLANKRMNFKNMSLRNIFHKKGTINALPAAGASPATGAFASLQSQTQPGIQPNLIQGNTLASQSANNVSPAVNTAQSSSQPLSSSSLAGQNIDPYIEQQFTSYVESHVSSGVTKEQLYGMFIKAGWNKNMLDYLFDKHCLLFITPEERQQVENYIRYYVSKGLSRDSIRQGLVGAGWDVRVIEELMKEF